MARIACIFFVFLALTVSTYCAKVKRRSLDASAAVKNVYVRKGDPFEVKCESQELLSNCTLLSPNGTLYKDSSIIYEGSKEELRNCNTKIKVADKSHSGQWTCSLATRRGPEIRSNPLVIVKDTRLMAVENVITLPSDGQTDLICQPLPDSNEVIESCRWGTPLNYVIDNENSEYRITETNRTHCKLTFRDHDPNDAGEWSCYARFVGSSEEESDRIQVKYTIMEMSASDVNKTWYDVSRA